MTVPSEPTKPIKRAWWRVSLFVLLMLLIEFMDEFTYSGIEVARPLFRDEFGLTYIQVGLITTVPILVATFIEPIVGLYADRQNRRLQIVVGGVLFGIGLLIQGFAQSFTLFMLGLVVMAPANGVFVNLAQASLGDDAPNRRENRMALWALSGSLAVVLGPALLSLMVALGSGWRLFFIGSGVVAIVLALCVWLLPSNPALSAHGESDDDDSEEDDALANMTFRERLQTVGALLRRGYVWRWLILLQFSDLLLDVLFSLLALYMVDAVGVTQAQAGIAIIVWNGFGLLGDLLLIPFLERVDGIRYLRVSVVVQLFLYPAFLLIDGYGAKLVLLGAIGLFNAGWYAILVAKSYDTLGEQSGAVLVVGNVAGIFGALLPVALGAIAQVYSLEAAMWCLLAGPVALLIGLPRNNISSDT
ncbi:MAG: MFS transporter [Chloroflexota bacterium]